MPCKAFKFHFCARLDASGRGGGGTRKNIVWKCVEDLGAHVRLHNSALNWNRFRRAQNNDVGDLYLNVYTCPYQCLRCLISCHLHTNRLRSKWKAISELEARMERMRKNKADEVDVFAFFSLACLCFAAYRAVRAVPVLICPLQRSLARPPLLSSAGTRLPSEAAPAAKRGNRNSRATKSKEEITLSAERISTTCE